MDEDIKMVLTEYLDTIRNNIFNIEQNKNKISIEIQDRQKAMEVANEHIKKYKKVSEYLRFLIGNGDPRGIPIRSKESDKVPDNYFDDEVEKIEKKVEINK